MMDEGCLTSDIRSTLVGGLYKLFGAEEGWR